MTYDVTAHLRKFCINLHKSHRFVVKLSLEGATCHPLLSPPRHCFAVILSPGALRVKRVDGSDGSRAVT